jgi:hypothetical protein
MTESTHGSADVDNTSGAKDKSQDKVAYETYLKVLSEAKNAKEKLRLLEASAQEMNDNKLKEQNEWKALAESKEKSLLETTSKLNHLESTILESVKLNAFQRHLGGKIKDDAYYQFVDTDKIAYNPETKRVDEESVKSVVADFVKRHSSLVEFKGGKMPNEAASNSRITTEKKIEDMTTLEVEQYIKKLHLSGAI